MEHGDIDATDSSSWASRGKNISGMNLVAKTLGLVISPSLDTSQHSWTLRILYYELESSCLNTYMTAFPCYDIVKDVQFIFYISGLLRRLQTRSGRD